MCSVILKLNPHLPKNYVIYFNKNPLKMMKYALFFISKALFIPSHLFTWPKSQDKNWFSKRTFNCQKLSLDLECMFKKFGLPKQWVLCNDRCLSVCLSACHFEVFLGDHALVFFAWSQIILKSKNWLYFNKNGQNWPKIAKNKGFLKFFKNFLFYFFLNLVSSESS